ncbi:hypothetical protein Efla_002906 [Eimeria flavescens]
MLTHSNMRKDGSLEELRYRALSGARVGDLMRQTGEALYNTVQPEAISENAARGNPAGLQVEWGVSKLKTFGRKPVPSSTSEVKATLCGSGAESDAVHPCPRKSEQFEQRNSSGKIYDVMQGGKVDGEKSEPLNFYGPQGLLFDSANQRSAQSAKKQAGAYFSDRVGELIEHRFINVDSSAEATRDEHCGGKLTALLRRVRDTRDIIHHGHEGASVKIQGYRPLMTHQYENPRRWGVDVLNYQLPPPRKLKGIPLPQNLGPGLVPNHSFDENSLGCRPRKDFSSRDCAQDHLERARCLLNAVAIDERPALEASSLHPLESASQKFAQAKRRSNKAGDALDQTCTPYQDQALRGIRQSTPSIPRGHLEPGLVPCIEDDRSRRRCDELWKRDNLQKDLTLGPSEFPRRFPSGVPRDSLHLGSLTPLRASNR